MKTTYANLVRRSLALTLVFALAAPNAFAGVAPASARRPLAGSQGAFAGQAFVPPMVTAHLYLGSILSHASVIAAIALPWLGADPGSNDFFNAVALAIISEPRASTPSREAVRFRELFGVSFEDFSAAMDADPSLAWTWASINGGEDFVIAVQKAVVTPKQLRPVGALLIVPLRPAERGPARYRVTENLVNPP
jgi:hypothetical protein